MKGKSPPKRPSSQHTKVVFVVLEGQREGNKRQRQDTEVEAKGEGNKGKGEEVFVLEGKALFLDRVETDAAHKNMAVYKDTRGIPC